MEECIPKHALSRRRNLPWLSKNILNQSGRGTICTKELKEVDVTKVSRLCKSKATFLMIKGLNPRNPKKIWKAVKYLNKQKKLDSSSFRR